MRKPRIKVSYEEGPRKAELDEAGQPIFPPGLPHCRRDALIYASGMVRCDICRDDLCGDLPDVRVGRTAEIDTCGNCGLVLKVETRPSGRSPGPPEAGRRGRRLSLVKPLARPPRP